MSEAATQCASKLGATRCQLHTGHRSAHAARTGATLTTWANPDAGEQAKLVVLDWYLE
ncbi:MAG TPA: hypothetical protein VE441_09625 [Mycobacterium sp.]|nr:hypothetical protein [Mycobacterium sp.]